MNKYSSTASTPDNLIAGPNHIAIGAVVASGAGVLGRGSVLGKLTSGGKFVLVQSDGTDDGRRTAAAILAQNVDASTGDVVCAVYIKGEFNERALTFGGTDDADDHRAALQAIGIILRDSVEVN